MYAHHLGLWGLDESGLSRMGENERRSLKGDIITSKTTGDEASCMQVAVAAVSCENKRQEGMWVTTYSYFPTEGLFDACLGRHTHMPLYVKPGTVLIPRPRGCEASPALCAVLAERAVGLDDTDVD